MKSGNWKENTFEFIKIHPDGSVADGQHRLFAVIKSGVSVVFDIVYNVPKDVFVVLDTGKHRNGSDVFKISGVKNDNMLPSIIQIYVAMNSGHAERGSTELTNDQLLEEYNKSPEFWQEIAHRAAAWYVAFAKILNPSLIGGLYAHLCFIDHVKATEFFNQACTGAAITNNTVLILRNRLIEDKTALRKMGRANKVALIIKAWNAMRKGIELKQLKFTPDKEEFPKAV